MNRLLHHIKLYSLLLFLLFSVGGCGLLPKEEEIPTQGIVSNYKVQEYKKIKVVRGDIIEQVIIDCVFESFNERKYSFDIDGIVIDHVYVNEGDIVQKGDVLADLEMNQLEEQIENYEFDIALLELQIKNEKELSQWAENTSNELKNIEGYNNYIQEKYDLEILNHKNAENRILDNLYIAQKRLDLLYEDRNNRVIIADMDGVISQIAKYNRYDTSNQSINFIQVYDPTNMIFVPNKANIEYLIPNQVYTLNFTNGEAEVLVIETQMEEGINTEKYLQVVDENLSFVNGDKGRVTVVLKEVKDVLYLPVAAVGYKEDKAFVYVEDEGGFKSVKEIEIGITADKKVEIISGLKEGDSVILD